jgi:mono/diheme cytochrome c family protein
MMYDQLLAIKAYLYAILAALLLVLCGAIYTITTRAKPEQMAYCGNVSPLTSNEKYSRGKELFLTNCASCHNKNMRDNLTGPALGPSLQAWAKYPPKDLFAYIRNSQAVTKKRHPRALEIWKQYQPTVMPAFQSLTDEDIKALFDYIKG